MKITFLGTNGWYTTKAGVKNLFLTHFMDDFYPTVTSRKKAEKAAQKIFKNSTSAFDGMSVDI